MKGVKISFDLTSCKATNVTKKMATEIGEENGIQK